MVHNLCMTILLILIIRIFYSIPTPGVNTDFLKLMAESNQAFSLMDMITGGGFSNLTVMALNVTPYITASIIIQLLTNVFKKLHDLKHGMKDDQKQVERLTIALSVILAFIESAAIAYGYGKKGVLISNTWYWVLLVSVTWTIGAAMAAILGKRIQDKYKFNGISILLLLNIVSSYPSGAYELYQTFMEGHTWTYMVVTAVLIFFIVLFLFGFTYIIQESEKVIKVNYSGKSSSIGGNKQVGSFPLKMCPGGVVPVIFASTIMTIPAMIASAFTSSETLWIKILSSNAWFHLDDMLPTVGIFLYIILIFGFSYFYAYSSLNPYEIAESFQKDGGTISGIRPGKPTEEYLKKQMKGVIAIGAAALTFIAVIPIVLSGIFGLSKISFLGTSIIITVGVLSEIKKSIYADTKSKKYKPTKKTKGGIF